jgi:hypothetical protein
VRRLAALAIFAPVLLVGCDPVSGTGPGTAPNPTRFLQVDDAARSAVLTLVAAYPVTDYQFNYNGYAHGALVITVPVGWTVTVQCQNHGTVPNSCAVVDGAGSTRPLQPSWATPDPIRGLQPGESASFTFTPEASGIYRIASLVPGAEASGMWATLQVVSQGRPSISAAD